MMYTSIVRDTGLDEHTWRMRAVSTWPAETVHLAPHTPYKTYRVCMLCGMEGTCVREVHVVFTGNTPINQPPTHNTGDGA